MFETNVLTISDEKRILEGFISNIPNSYMGPDRVKYIAENGGSMEEQDKIKLRDFIDRTLTLMIETEASDIEIGGHGNEEYIWMRTHGVKERIKDLPQFTEDETAVIILNLINENQKQYLISNRNLDFSYTYYYERRKLKVRCRADAYFDLDSLTLNMRLINLSIRPLDTLGFHPLAIRSFSHNYIKFGLTLITGITGSGKSTTLDSIIDYHNRFDPSHVILISAPIEYVHSSNVCLIKHREVGRDVLSFKDGIVQALRQDPDIIVVGEMRDAETIMAALEVTDTGHKIFSTLHTSSATESLDRIIAEVNPTEQERVRNRLADVLISVISQKLVPALDGRRVMAKEVLIVTPSVKAAIKNNNTSEIYMMINQGGAQGMVTMEQDLKRLYMQKLISLETAIIYANNKTQIQQILSPS
ncbi:MAG: ATPase, T2SS/T4P/T4SS family [Ignavibacteria bacterium]|nr:ATPase, T2SS/T4P/T4SS family [Ignavibacteria bacterium]